MKNIRRGVFETNSSSMHSLAVHHQDFMTRPEILNGYFGEFGWGPGRLTSPEEKLSYVLTALGIIVQGTEYNLSSDEVKTRLLAYEKYGWLNEAIKDYTGNEIIMDFESGDRWHPFGYIDHQSFEHTEVEAPDVMMSFWTNEKDTFQNNMREFIFNKKYTVIIDNDNH